MNSITKNKSIILLVCILISVLNIFAIKYKTYGDSIYSFLIVHVVVFVLVTYLIFMIQRNQNKTPLDKISFGTGILFIILNFLFGFAIIGLWNIDKDYNAQTAKVQMEVFGEKLSNFKSNCGRYPLTEEGLAFLVTELKDNVCKHYPADGFLKGGQVPLNPWDQEFQYQSDGQKYLLKTQFEKRVFIKTDKSAAYEVEDK